MARVVDCMTGVIERFFQRPTLRAYLAARNVVLAHSHYQGLSLALAELSLLCEEGDFNGVLHRAEDLEGVWFLSPRLHLLAAVASTELGQESNALRERELFAACMRGLMATGDGTRKRPYRVTYRTDEHDAF